ncbi:MULTISPECIES: hypothetical protein [Aerococcus]|uniref:Uncharacterized protein n=1 Tax=Aerococcus sanguinicola TaxID=119206 RepID=A0A5N1GM46_9LACT|nr:MULTISPECIES: hypothetical protein [Aerococcus]KAA9302043.1 hypothetical protein F6I03_02195 [Aerococcus sanguinicola]MDK6368533.1 hypothetical protein [Aerococcus sp. UMB9870]MDK6679616.1 hypothetical protein [Aerococcus sp. UMB8608]MDK6686460.1 hypothetical protein [Aerococcus sp. UMB8623]MDK6940918.1 hypothetical protein [Aerococcus sp. UMB8487]
MLFENSTNQRAYLLVEAAASLFLLSLLVHYLVTSTQLQLEQLHRAQEQVEFAEYHFQSLQSLSQDPNWLEQLREEGYNLGEELGYEESVYIQLLSKEAH